MSIGRRNSLGGFSLASLAAAALVILPWTLPSKAGAAVTIGSDLTPDPMNSVACIGACTKANTANPGQQVSSPIDGVVVRWRLRGQAGIGEPVDFKLRVLRPNAAGTSYTGINSSTTRTVSDTTLTTHVFPAQQAIAAGDLIGLDVGSGAGNFVAETNPMAGVSLAVWGPPPIGDDETLPTSPFEPADEILVNADLEPDCDSDGLGDEMQDPDTSSCNPPPSTTSAPTGQRAAAIKKCKKKFRGKAKAKKRKKCIKKAKKLPV
jgi:hypothetical protein